MSDTSFVALLQTAANRIGAVWLNQVNKGLFWGRRPNYGTTTGSANAQILTLETGSLYSIGSEADGDEFWFKAGFTCSGAMTLQVVPPSGTNIARAVQLNQQALVGGEVLAGSIYKVQRLGVTWQLFNYQQGVDGQPIAVGSADPTKKLRFSLAGLTTVTTRVVTWADQNLTFGALTTKGDSWWASGAGVTARLPVGTDGQTLRADSSQTLGVGWSAPDGPISAGRNIAVRTNAAAPNTKLDIAADEFILRNATGGVKLAVLVTGTIDFGTVGANGIDAGTQAAATWYYGWVIMKEDGTTALLGSLSATAPTLPSGYTYKALITAARSDGSVHFIPYRQVGTRCFYEVRQQVLSGGSASTETAIVISSVVPPIAQAFLVGTDALFTASGGGGFSTTEKLRFISGNDYANAQAGSTTATTAGTGFTVEMPNISLALFYFFSPTTNISAAAINVNILSFKLPGGGE